MNPQPLPAFWRHWWSESFANKSSQVLWFQLYDNGKEARANPAVVGFIKGKGQWEPVTLWQLRSFDYCPSALHLMDGKLHALLFSDSFPMLIIFPVRRPGLTLGTCTAWEGKADLKTTHVIWRLQGTMLRKYPWLWTHLIKGINLISSLSSPSLWSELLTPWVMSLDNDTKILVLFSAYPKKTNCDLSSEQFQDASVCHCTNKRWGWQLVYEGFIFPTFSMVVCWGKGFWL